jgi:hypothetical protein
LPNNVLNKMNTKTTCYLVIYFKETNSKSSFSYRNICTMCTTYMQLLNSLGECVFKYFIKCKEFDKC